MSFPKLLQRLFQNSGAGSMLNPEIIPTDSALSDTSTYPVQNKVVKAAIDAKTFPVDTVLSTTSTNPVQNKVVKAALDALNTSSVDSALSTTSTNPVQNKVVKAALDAKLNTSSVDSALSTTSTNPVQNKVVATAVNTKLPLTGGNITGSLSVGGVEVVPIANNAAAHNAIYRGIDLTTKYTEAQISAKIQAGDFSDLFIGDYIPKTLTIDGTSVTANWVIAHFDYYRRIGNTADGLSTNFEVNVPHVVLVPDRSLINAQMNTTNTTAGGYLGSAMHTTTIPKISTALQNGFGSSRVISFASYLSSDVNTSLASMAGCGWTGATAAWGCTWTKVECRLMSEQMVYGSAIFSSSASDAGEAKQQFALFALNPQATNIRANWWLSAVASSASFAFVSGDGVAYAGTASTGYGVRPFFLYH